MGGGAAPRLWRWGGALLPAAALWGLSTHFGTWTGAATAAGATVGHLAVLLAALVAGRAWRDPLGLGRRGRWLLAGLLVTVMASCWASPAGRAGWTVVALLPAWLLVPAAVARLWGGRPRTYIAGPAAVAGVVGSVAATALAGMYFIGDPRASAPLGHHNLLAVWLLALLPLAALSWRGSDRGQLPTTAHRKWGDLGLRALSAVSVGLGLAALVATRSLSGALGLAAMVVVALGLRRSLRRAGDHSFPSQARTRRPRLGWRGALLAGLLLAPLLLSLPRLASMVRGVDLSLAARQTYWLAGAEGFAQRPALGWGPGSTPWTLGEWLRPVPGINPPQEMVGDLHSLPLALLYELGATGLALTLAIVGLFLWRCRRRLRRAPDPGLVAAGIVGLVGAGVATLAVAPLAVPAVVLALAVATGAALAGGQARGEVSEVEPDLAGSTVAPVGRVGSPAWPVWLWVLAAGMLLGRLDLAHHHYDRSLESLDESARPAARTASLREAVRWDPAFPLYRTHLARARWESTGGLHGGESASSGSRADIDAVTDALTAAEDAVAVAALWLVAGDLAWQAGEPWSGIVLERACRLDPLGAPAPFLLALEAWDAGGQAAAAVSAARAFLAEPRLVAAVAFDERPGLLPAAMREVLAWSGASEGWRVGLVEQVGAWGAAPRGGLERAVEPGEFARLRLTTGSGPAESLALHVFRRSTRPLQLAAIAVHRERAKAITVPAASTLPETFAAAFDERGCEPPTSVFDTR